MADVYSEPGEQGAGGTATARAREHSDQEARERRIAELRRRYLEGTYQVDARELSAAIIQEHLAENALTPHID